MIIYHLLILLLISALIQTTREDRATACTFAVLSMAFVLTPVLDDQYHLVGALFEFLCVLMLAKIGGKSALVLDLQRLCLLSVVLNVAGYVCYEMGLEATPYNVAGIVFYCITIMSLILRRIGDAHTSATTYRSWLPFYFHSNFISDREHEEGARNWQAN